MWDGDILNGLIFVIYGFENGRESLHWSKAAQPQIPCHELLARPMPTPLEASFPLASGARLTHDAWKKRHFNKKSPNFIPIPIIPISIKVQSSRISSTFEVFGSNFLGPPQKQHVLPRCNENCLLGRTTWCLKMEGSQNSVSLIGKSHAPLPFLKPMGNFSRIDPPLALRSRDTVLPGCPSPSYRCRCR